VVLQLGGSLRKGRVYKLHPPPFLVSRYALHDRVEVSLSILTSRLESRQRSHQGIFLSAHEQRWICREHEEKKKLLGIGRWLQRQIMLYSGHGDALFHHAATHNPKDKDSINDSSASSGLHNEMAMTRRMILLHQVKNSDEEYKDWDDNLSSRNTIQDIGGICSPTSDSLY
jgi:hypothetical protein